MNFNSKLLTAAKLPQHHSSEWNGLDIVIEWPKNSIRVGKNEDGKSWRREMKADYGYIRGVNGHDGEPQDVYIGEDTDSDKVYAIQQLKEDGATLDEVKLVLGTPDLLSAQELYLAHYPENWENDRLGEIAEMPFEELVGMVEEHQEPGKTAAVVSKAGTAVEAERILAEVDTEEEVVLFHSSTSDKDNSIRENWLEPQIGEWVNEVLEGATDNPELIQQIREESTGVVYLDNIPRWVISQVSRKVNKSNNEVTGEDVRKWGQLTIVVVDKQDSGIRRYLGDTGEQQYPAIEDLRGREEKFYDSDNYFGLESGDYFSDESVEPAITLVGDELVKFLKKHYPMALVQKQNWGDMDDRRAIRDGSYWDKAKTSSSWSKAKLNMAEAAKEVGLRWLRDKGTDTVRERKVYLGTDPNWDAPPSLHLLCTIHKDGQYEMGVWRDGEYITTCKGFKPEHLKRDISEVPFDYVFDKVEEHQEKQKKTASQTQVENSAAPGTYPTAAGKLKIQNKTSPITGEGWLLADNRFVLNKEANGHLTTLSNMGYGSIDSVVKYGYDKAYKEGYIRVSLDYGVGQFETDTPMTDVLYSRLVQAAKRMKDVYEITAWVGSGDTFEEYTWDDKGFNKIRPKFSSDEKIANTAPGTYPSRAVQEPKATNLERYVWLSCPSSREDQVMRGMGMDHTKFCDSRYYSPPVAIKEYDNSTRGYAEVKNDRKYVVLSISPVCRPEFLYYPPSIIEKFKAMYPGYKIYTGNGKTAGLAYLKSLQSMTL